MTKPSAHDEDSSQPTSLSVGLYERLRKKASTSWRRKARSREPDHLEGAAAPFGPGREAKPLGDVLAGLSDDLGWTPFLLESEIVAAWAEIVGEDVAQKTAVTGIAEDVLTVTCESTAWATQLTFMSSQILTKLINMFPAATVSKINFIGPNAPSWKRGPRSVPGRGPRDTYG